MRIEAPMECLGLIQISMVQILVWGIFYHLLNAGEPWKDVPHTRRSTEWTEIEGRWAAAADQWPDSSESSPADGSRWATYQCWPWMTNLPWMLNLLKNSAFTYLRSHITFLKVPTHMNTIMTMNMNSFLSFCFVLLLFVFYNKEMGGVVRLFFKHFKADLTNQKVIK